MDAPAGSDTLTAPDVKSPDVNANVTARPNRGEDSTGAASPRTDTVRHFSIFGLSFTASIVLGAALLLGVIPAIVAMTGTRGTPYIDNTSRAVAPVATVMAQPGRSPANPETSPSNPGGIHGTAEPPTMPRVEDQKLNKPPAVPAPRQASAPAVRNGMPGLQPRGANRWNPATSRTAADRMFEIPLIAVMVGAAGLVGIIVAISVSMHRRIDRRRWRS